MKSAIFNNTSSEDVHDQISYVYRGDCLKRIADITDVYPKRISAKNFDAEAPFLEDIEVIFSTWGMPQLSAEQVAKMPNLKVVFYAAGSIKGFAPPFLERGIIVCSAAPANAVPVAEFCTAQILLSCKRYFSNTRSIRTKSWSNANKEAGKGVYGETIALIGAGVIARNVITFLSAFNLRIIVVDPYLERDPNEAKALGIAKVVSMEEAFSEAYVVSNHLPNLDSLRKVITKSHFSSMREGATFINTGRGAQVDEAGLVEIFTQREDLTALLDVSDPEPPLEGSPITQLPNIQLSSHIAGSLNDEVQRMADNMLEECMRYQKGEALQYAVGLAKLENMA